MARANLVFVEGMPGAGKSTTARNIAEWLRAQRLRARSFHEMDDDNPIRTKGVDAMRANHPHTGPLPGVGDDGFALDPSAYAVEQWGVLARRCRAGDETVVLESRYIQNSVQPRFLAGAPRTKVHDGFRRIREQVAPARPLLVYLRPSDVRGHLRATLESRDRAWGEWILASFSGYAWAKSRGLSGEEAFLGFYEEWEEIADELFALHAGPKLRLVDPQLDWSAALARTYAALAG